MDQPESNPHCYHCGQLIQGETIIEELTGYRHVGCGTVEEHERMRRHDDTSD